MMSRGHQGHCICSCAQDAWGTSDYPELEDGQYPYPGIKIFWGEDAESRGLKVSPVWSSDFS